MLMLFFRPLPASQSISGSTFFLGFHVNVPTCPRACLSSGSAAVQVGPQVSLVVAQTVMNLPATRQTRVQSLGGADPLEESMVAHFSTLAWRIPWTEEPGGLQPMGSQRVRHNWATNNTLRNLSSSKSACYFPGNLTHACAMTPFLLTKKIFYNSHSFIKFPARQMSPRGCFSSSNSSFLKSNWWFSREFFPLLDHIQKMIPLSINKLILPIFLTPLFSLPSSMLLQFSISRHLHPQKSRLPSFS